MKNYMKILALLLITLFGCSNDDGDSLETLDEINQTEWAYEVSSSLAYYIYFSEDGNSALISHPFQSNKLGEYINKHIYGTFTYNKPKVNIKFKGLCSEKGFIFSSCDVSGIIEGNRLIIKDNGTDYIFDNLYQN